MHLKKIIDQTDQKDNSIGPFERKHEINIIPGLKMVEMENIRAKSVCCCCGGNLEMTNTTLSGKLARALLNV